MSADWDEEAHFIADAKRGSEKLLRALIRFSNKGNVAPIVHPCNLRSPAPISEIQRVAAQYSGLPIRVMTNGDTSLSAIQARQLAMYLAVVHLGKSKSEVARRFGNMDRTTVYHAVLRVCRTEELYQKAMAIKALLDPVDNGEKLTISKNLGAVNAIEQSVKMQGERIAA